MLLRGTSWNKNKDKRKYLCTTDSIVLFDLHNLLKYDKLRLEGRKTRLSKFGHKKSPSVWNDMHLQKRLTFGFTSFYGGIFIYIFMKKLWKNHCKPRKNMLQWNCQTNWILKARAIFILRDTNTLFWTSSYESVKKCKF